MESRRHAPFFFLLEKEVKWELPEADDLIDSDRQGASVDSIPWNITITPIRPPRKHMSIMSLYVSRIRSLTRRCK